MRRCRLRCCGGTEGPKETLTASEECGEEVGREAHGRHDHDVHGRVAVEPEPVLPQERLSAGRRTHPVEGLENYEEMMRLLTTEKQAVKVYVKVRPM